MILVDTSVWVDHLRSGDQRLGRALEEGSVLSHPWVEGELALGGLRPGSPARELMSRLPRAAVAADEEILVLVDRAGLAGSGIGYVDAGLLAAARLTPGTLLWTRDGRLRSVAGRLGVGYRE